MTFGSCFAGIGGMDLGLERAGWTCRWQIENDPRCIRVLQKHWPNVKRYGDIAEVNGSELEPVDFVVGGFPCQDISNQGAVWGIRAGLDGERSGLWWKMLETVRLVRPRGVVVENVAAILGNGLATVVASLSEIGYDSEWDCIPAFAFGLPHERYRMLLVAYNREERRKGRWSKPIRGVAGVPWFKDVRGLADLRGRSDLPEPLVRRTGDGISLGLDRLAGIGNAVVPQVAEWLGLRIIEAENN